MYDQFLKKLRILPLLVVVASLSFAIRLGEIAISPQSSVGSAIAQETSDKKLNKTSSTPEMVDNNAIEKEPSNNLPSPSTTWKSPDEDEIEFSSIKAELFETLTKRRKELDKRENSIEKKEALLDAAEQQITQKYNELVIIRKEIQSLLQQQSEEEIARIKSLVKVYEGMKAKDAAAIFNTLDMDILINVTSNMSERKLSPIMAAMSPDRARSVTIFLAEQKSLPTLPEQ